MPAAKAASSLDLPSAIPDQNRCSSVRPATGGRPGEGNGARPDRCDLRRLMFIATSFVQALRRPVEWKQYCSVDYQALLRRRGILISMSGRGNCYDNSMVETFFKTIKSELIWQVAWQSRKQAENAVARYIDGFYNPVRRHSSLGFQSPIAFERNAREMS